MSFSSDHDDLDPQTACCPPTEELADEDDVSELAVEEEEEPLSSPPARDDNEDDQDEGSSSTSSSGDDRDPPEAATTQPLRSRDPRLLPEHRRALERGAAATDPPPPPPPPPPSFGLKLLALHRDLVRALTKGASDDDGEDTTPEQLLDRLNAAASEALACPSLAAELAIASKRARRATRRVQKAQRVADDAAQAIREAADKARQVVDETEFGGGHGGSDDDGGGPVLPPRTANATTTRAATKTTRGKRRRRVQEDDDEEEDANDEHNDDAHNDTNDARAAAAALRAQADAAVQARRQYVLSLRPLIPRFNSHSAQTTARAVSLTKKGGSSRFAHVYYLGGAWSAQVRRAGVQVPRALFHDEVTAAQAVDEALANAGMPKVNEALVELRRRLEGAGWFGVEDRTRRLGMLLEIGGSGVAIAEAEAEALRPIPASWTRKLWRKGVFGRF